MEFLLLLRDIALALLDTVTGRGRRRYEHALLVAAPRATVWDLLMSRDISLDGSIVPIRAIIEHVAGRPGVDRSRILIGSQELQMMTLTLETRDGVAELHEILVEGTHPSLVEGIGDYMGFTLLDASGGTILTLLRDVAPRSLFRRIAVPLSLRGGAKRYKRKAESLMRDEPGAMQRERS